MKTTRSFAGGLALAFGLVGAAGTATAGNPDPASRRQAVVESFGQVLVCQGGAQDGQVCQGDFECAGPPEGHCNGVRGARLIVRGELTVIADTVLTDPPPADPFLEVDPSQPCNGCEGQAGRSSYTLLLEFTKDGKRFTFADTYPGITQDSVNSFAGVGSEIPNWSVGAFESTLVNSFDTIPDYKIRFGLLPPAASQAVAAALGEPGKVPVTLEAEEVPACTDPAACNHCTGDFSNDACLVTNSEWSKHSAPTDVLASVRKFKVGIGFIDPPPPAP